MHQNMNLEKPFNLICWIAVVAGAIYAAAQVFKIVMLIVY